MSDPNHHPQAKLKELIERASTAAEINFKKGREVAPKGFAFEQMALDLPSNPFQEPAMLRPFQ